MESFDIGGMAGLGALGAAGVLVTALRVRLRRRRAAARMAPAVRLDSLAAAQAALAARLDGLADEGGSEGKLQAMAGQLVALIRDKNAAMETAMAGLDQLRARLRTLEQVGEPAEARALLEKVSERLDALQAAQAAGGAAFEARLEAIERRGEAPAAALAERLARLFDQKEAGLAVLLGRLGTLEQAVAARAPQAGLEAVQGRLAALEKADSPAAEIAERLTGLYGQKDAALEALLDRLAPLEAKLAELDPRPEIDRFAERIEAVRGALDARLAALENAENPFGGISEQLTRLYAQKDATVEAVLGRLAPLEAKLVELERAQADQDPQAALDRFAVRLEAVQARVGTLENAENPFGEISEQLTRLYAQKDATVEAVLGRLAPLEAKLAELDAGLARLAPLAEADPSAEIDGLAARLAELHWAQGEVAAGLAALKAAGEDAAPLGEVADRLTRLYAQKDAMVEAVLARLQPIETRLAAIEGRPWDPDADEARAQAQAIAAQLIAARAAAEQTGLIADRLALLEASLPRLSAAQALMVQALEARTVAPLPVARARSAGSGPGWGVEPVAAPIAAPQAITPAAAPAAADVARQGPAAPPEAPAAPPAAADDLDGIWRLPRLISLHRK